MQKIKIGILKEGKVPIDRRVPLTPSQARQTKETFHVDVVAQNSPVRCYTDDDYENEGIKTVANLEDCDILMGVKEVPIEELIENKTYLFFSHTIKEQPYNRELLRAILKKNIRLIDYEKLTNSKGHRLIAFGRYAGIVGAYNGIWAYGKRFGHFELKRANECDDLEDLKSEYVKVKLPPVKIALTGGGRVAKGSMEVLNGMGIRKVTPSEFLSTSFEEPVYTQLSSRDYNASIDGHNFTNGDFYKNPESFKSDFRKYISQTDILIAAAYWHPMAPVLFTRKDMSDPKFSIKVIADITCDIEGSIPSTKMATTIEDPLYDYNPKLDQMEPPISSENNITVMAVDNLPCELPKDSSSNFGKQLIDNILPPLLGEDNKGIIKRATITDVGKLTEEFSYLQGYING